MSILEFYRCADAFKIQPAGSDVFFPDGSVAWYDNVAHRYMLLTVQPSDPPYGSILEFSDVDDVVTTAYITSFFRGYKITKMITELIAAADSD